MKNPVRIEKTLACRTADGCTYTLHAFPTHQYHPDLVNVRILERGTVLTSPADAKVFGTVETFMYDGDGHLIYIVRRMKKDGTAYKKQTFNVVADDVPEAWKPYGGSRAIDNDPIVASYSEVAR